MINLREPNLYPCLKDASKGMTRLQIDEMGRFDRDMRGSSGYYIISGENVFRLPIEVKSWAQHRKAQELIFPERYSYPFMVAVSRTDGKLSLVMI